MISVIVPAYNVASEIARTLDSILAQTLSDIEVIAVNDGSTDGTGAVLDTYARNYPEKIRVIHQENSGVMSARLAGVKAAEGEWIGFVDGDDYVEPDMYKRLLKNAQTHNADISHCGYRMVFADGRVNYFHNTGLLVQQDKLTGLKDLLAGSKIEPGLWSKLFHKNLLHSLFHGEMMDTSIRINEDLLMNYYLFAAAEHSVFEDWCPYHYIVRSTSASRSKLNLNRIWDPIRVKQKILHMDVPGMGQDARRAYLSTCINVYNGLMLERSREFRSEEPQIHKLIQVNRQDVSLLTKKQQMLARLILLLPGLYRYLYRFYARFFLVNRYM